MRAKVDLAVVGAASAGGEALLALLPERAFPYGRVHALDQADAVGGTVAFGNRELVIEEVGGFDFATVQLVFCVADAALAAAVIAKVTAAGGRVIDASGFGAAQADIPLLAPLLSVDAADDASAGFDAPVIASPGAAALQLALALAPINAAAGLARVQVCTLHAVSGQGRAAVEELGRQTADLLNFRDLSVARLPKQIAFNVIPQIGPLDDDGDSVSETRLIHETRRLLGLPSLPMHATSLLVPVFYGDGQSVQLETLTPLGVEAARAALAAAAQVVIADDGSPTPVTDASGADTVQLGRLRADRSRPQGLSFWTVADNLRLGAALNLVTIAERLIRSSC